MMNPNDIVLVTREEIDQLTDSPISDDVWERVREYIISDDNMWEVIDECIKNTVSAVCD